MLRLFVVISKHTTKDDLRKVFEVIEIEKKNEILLIGNLEIWFHYSYQTYC
jgi:hypothetical protein